jgi:excisionase family DNA binding protein
MQPAAEIVADGLMTVTEAADFLRVARTRIYELMASGDLCYVKLGKSRRIPRRALVRLAERHLSTGGRS